MATAQAQTLPTPSFKSGTFSNNTTFSGGISTQIGTSIMMSGAACDGTTDDTSVINTYLTSLNTSGRGAVVYVPSNHMCYIGSGNLVVPQSVRIVGEAAAIVSKNTQSFSAGFVLNPSYTISMSENSQLSNLKIFRSGLLTNPTDAQVIAAVAQWGTENSRGITVAGGWVRLEHLEIIGFNTALWIYGKGDYIIDDIVGDDYNGFFLTGAGDNDAIHDVRFEPFYAIFSTQAWGGSEFHISSNQGSTSTTLQFASGTIGSVQVGDYAAVKAGTDAGAIPLGTTVSAVNNSTGVVTLSAATTTPLTTSDWVQIGGAWDRPGTGFFFQGSNGNTTGWYAQRLFAYMYHYGYVIADTGVGYLSDSDVEFDTELAPGSSSVGTAGVRVIGHNSGLNITNMTTGGAETEYLLDTSQQVKSLNLTVGYPLWLPDQNVPEANAVGGAYLAGPTGTGATVTLSGTPAAGNTVSIVINGITFSYTAVTGDNLTSINSALDRQIAVNPTLVAAHIFPQFQGSLITIYAPSGTSLTVTQSATGGITATGGTGGTQVGAWTMLDGVTWGGPVTLPMITVAPNSTAVSITNLPPGNNGGLQNGAINIQQPNSRVQFIGMPAAGVSAGNLTGCGSGSPSINSVANDQMGTITEGTSATGCTLTFHATYPQTPTCYLSSPNGATWTGYTVSTTALTITNSSATGNQYSYLCRP